MIIGSKDVDYSALKAACYSERTLLEFTINLVPTPLRHITAIVDNQKYFVALQVRAIQSMSWHKRKNLCESLLKGARIMGVPDSFYDYSDILLAIDREAFAKYLQEDENCAT